jgi:translation initiation factor IF-3
MNQVGNALRNAIKSYTRSSTILRAGLSSNAIGDEAAKKKKTVPEQRVTLINESDKMEVITLEKAKKLAEKRQMKLVNIVDFDTKSSRPIYKMMSAHEYHAEELKRREHKKELRNSPHLKAEKLLTLGSKITEHDLIAKAAKVKKWIEKMHEVRVVISCEGDNEKAEKVSVIIEEAGKEKGAKILQKRTQNNTIRYTVMPDIKKAKADAAAAQSSGEKKLLEPNNPNFQQIRNYSI